FALSVRHVLIFVRKEPEHWDFEPACGLCRVQLGVDLSPGPSISVHMSPVLTEGRFEPWLVSRGVDQVLGVLAGTVLSSESIQPQPERGCRRNVSLGDTRCSPVTFVFVLGDRADP